MGQIYLWEELTREEIKSIAPKSVVIVPLGATEQHGLAMPTGTDAFLVQQAANLGVQAAADLCDDDFLIAPFMRIGASEHHLPFGGTISLTPATLLQVLVEAIGSMRHSGVRRVILLNGHGGNSAICHAAGATLSTTTDLEIGVLDYWEEAPASSGDFQVPGHAGRWEAALMLAIRPDLIKDRSPRQDEKQNLPGRGIYTKAIWAGVDGYTDRPEEATTAEGAEVWLALGQRLGQRFHNIISSMT